MAHCPVAQLPTLTTERTLTLVLLLLLLLLLLPDIGYLHGLPWCLGAIHAEQAVDTTAADLAALAPNLKAVEQYAEVREKERAQVSGVGWWLGHGCVFQ